MKVWDEDAFMFERKVSSFSFLTVTVRLNLEKAMAPLSSTLAWKIPWAEKPGRLQSMGVAKSWTWLSDFTFTFHFHALEKEMATHSSVLAWRIPGMGEPGGLPSMGSHRVGHDWSDLAAAVESLWFFSRYGIRRISVSFGGWRSYSLSALRSQIPGVWEVSPWNLGRHGTHW